MNEPPKIEWHLSTPYSFDPHAANYGSTPGHTDIWCVIWYATVKRWGVFTAQDANAFITRAYAKTPEQGREIAQALADEEWHKNNRDGVIENLIN